MKTKTVVILSVLVLASMFVVVPVIAKQLAPWEHFAYGTFTDYYDDPDLPEVPEGEDPIPMGAEIVDGIWNLKVKDDAVWFYACVQEKNIDPDEENSPEGSIDILEYTLQGQPVAMGFFDGLSDGQVTARGTPAYSVLGYFKVQKQWAQFDGRYTTRTWKTFGAIEIYESGECIMNTWLPTLSEGDKLGTVTENDFVAPSPP